DCPCAPKGRMENTETIVAAKNLLHLLICVSFIISGGQMPSLPKNIWSEKSIISWHSFFQFNIFIDYWEIQNNEKLDDQAATGLCRCRPRAQFYAGLRKTTGFSVRADGCDQRFGGGSP